MDKIWDGNHSKLEVIGCCRMKKLNDHTRPKKSNTKNIFFIQVVPKIN